jgi:putative DNA modification/repair radical SAM protein
VQKNPDHTMEQMIQTLELLRYRYDFWGYIHAKTIPGASPELVRRLGLVADRLSVNIELPSELSLKRLAPHKSKTAILKPMAQIRDGLAANKQEVVKYRHAPRFAAAGQATQMIIGASPESDYSIMKLASGLYGQYGLKRVFYSAYIPAVEDSLLPAIDSKPPLLREHRLYQADFLLRQYQFAVEEILSEQAPNFNPYLDPKCNWAVNNMQHFPVDVNQAALPELLRVPGIGPTSARRIVASRRYGKLGLNELKRLGVVLKRARYFIVTSDQPLGLKSGRENTIRALLDPAIYSLGVEQLTLFGEPAAQLPLPPAGGVAAIDVAAKEAVLCLAQGL